MTEEGPLGTDTAEILNVGLRSLLLTPMASRGQVSSVSWCESNTFSLLLSGEQMGGARVGWEAGWEASAAARAEANGVAGLRGGDGLWGEQHTFPGCK